MNQPAPPFLWVVQPDAELELAWLSRGRGNYAPPSASVRVANTLSSVFSQILKSEWTFAHDLPAQRRPKTPERTALFWCPTPYALSQAQKAGLLWTPTPPLSVLLNVHHKAFPGQAGLPVMPERSTVRSIEDMERVLAARREGSATRLRRPYGFAGRGQRVLRRPLSADDHRFIHDSLAQEEERQRTMSEALLLRAALIVEPEVDAPDLWSIHGVVTQAEILIGEAVRNPSDPFGAPVISASPLDQSADELPLLAPTSSFRAEAQNLARLAAESLRRAGYFGPFGVDFIARPGSPHALIDLNPRFTLHFARGMGRNYEKALRRVLGENARGKDLETA